METIGLVFGKWLVCGPFFKILDGADCLTDDGTQFGQSGFEVGFEHVLVDGLDSRTAQMTSV